MPRKNHGRPSAESVALERLVNAISNAKRLAVLRETAFAEVSVQVLAERVGISQSALSQHLRKLKDARLIQARRVGQTIYYKSLSSDVADFLENLSAYLLPRRP